MMLSTQVAVPTLWLVLPPLILVFLAWIMLTMWVIEEKIMPRVNARLERRYGPEEPRG